MARSLANDLPEETDTGGFDVVVENQGISPLHVRSYLTAAAGALDEALRTGPRPEARVYEIAQLKKIESQIIGELEGRGLRGNTGTRREAATIMQRRGTVSETIGAWIDRSRGRRLMASAFLN